MSFSNLGQEMALGAALGVFSFPALFALNFLVDYELNIETPLSGVSEVYMRNLPLSLVLSAVGCAVLLPFLRKV